MAALAPLSAVQFATSFAKLRGSSNFSLEYDTTPRVSPRGVIQQALLSKELGSLGSPTLEKGSAGGVLSKSCDHRIAQS